MSMKCADQDHPGDPIKDIAATWVLRHDRGLSPSEQDSYLQWLAEDPRHGEAVACERRTWETFDRLAGLQASLQAVPDPDLFAPPKVAHRLIFSFRSWALASVLAAAAALVVVFHRPSPPVLADSLPAAAEVALMAPIVDRVLEDGSVVRLNRGAVIAVEFNPAKRRVLLLQGEAVFEVTKDAARPFTVVSGSVTVHAIGTVFNVRIGDNAIDVIVTEGRVSVAEATVPVETAPFLDAGQRMVVPLAPTGEPAVVSTPLPEELARRLAWQPRILTFTEEPLPVILNEFNRHNPVSLRLDDPTLQGLRLSARIRSDNLPGFLRLLKSEFRIAADVQAGGEIVLRSAQ